jgi:ribosomal protein L14
LRSGTKYTFCIEAPGYQAVAAIVNGKFQQLVRKGDVFEGVVVATKGDVTIAVRASSASAAYSSVCRYHVE